METLFENTPPPPPYSNYPVKLEMTNEGQKKNLLKMDKKSK